MAPTTTGNVNIGSGNQIQEASEGVPKWVWAVAIGVPVAAGVAYLLLSDSGTKKPKKEKKKKKAEKKTAAANTSGVTATAKAPESPKQKVTIEDAPEEQEPTDPSERALAAKNKGNKYFRGGRYELAIKCYSEAIEICPKDKIQDLSTFHQNRAAAYEQLDNHESVVKDCTAALELNNRYVKALERRARICRKQAEKSSDNAVAIQKLKQSLEDITSVCILEGFQKQDHLVMVDAVLKDLGRAEAKEAVKTREPVLTSQHFIQQYFQSFSEDPIMKSLEKESEGDVDEQSNNSISGYIRARHCLKSEDYDSIIDSCSEEIDSNEASAHLNEALLLRATFFILRKQQDLAFGDLTKIIENEEADPRVRVNALIKRASLFIQQCKDPIKDPELSFQDFALAERIDATNADIYHHRGQVHLLTDQIDQAISDFEKAVELNPGFPIAYVQKLYTDYRKALAENNSSEISKVIDEFDKAVEKFPKCVETYALFAQVLSDQQKFDRADEYYQRAEKIDPKNANLLVHRGLIQLQWKGDIAEAVRLMQRALELDDKCEFAYETLGTIEVQRGNMPKAVQLFEKAIPLANTELEMGHLFGLKDAAMAQTTVSERLGITMPGMM